MRPQTPKPTRQHLRVVAREYLQTVQKLELEPVTRSGRAPDAYFQCRDEDGRIFDVAIRTAKNARLAFKRKASGGWKTVDDADYVLIAAFGDGDPPKFADLYYLDAQHVIGSLDEAYAALSPDKKKVKGTFPVWISLEEEKGRRAAGSGVVQNAIDHISVPLDAKLQRHDVLLEDEQVEIPAVEIMELKERIARRLGLSASAVEVSVRIQL
jgi:hypothetical protein